jgi:steroid delta-isomerase-like uncharacterized protein
MRTVEKNKKTIRDFFMSIDEGNLRKVKELLASDFEMHSPALSKPLGVEEIIQVIKDFYKTFPDSTHEIGDILVEGDKIAIRLNQYGTHKADYKGIPATGNKINVAAMHMGLIEGGKIREWWLMEDTLGHMQQLGMILKPK